MLFFKTTIKVLRNDKPSGICYYNSKMRMQDAFNVYFKKVKEYEKAKEENTRLVLSFE